VFTDLVPPQELFVFSIQHPIVGVEKLQGGREERVEVRGRFGAEKNCQLLRSGG
jgi:hypothetical protein